MIRWYCAGYGREHVTVTEGVTLGHGHGHVTAKGGYDVQVNGAREEARGREKREPSSLPVREREKGEREREGDRGREQEGGRGTGRGRERKRGGEGNGGEGREGTSAPSGVMLMKSSMGYRNDVFDRCTCNPTHSRFRTMRLISEPATPQTTRG
eukprot:2594300-Rhodomonas_salina.2